MILTVSKKCTGHNTHCSARSVVKDQRVEERSSSRRGNGRLSGGGAVWAELWMGICQVEKRGDFLLSAQDPGGTETRSAQTVWGTREWSGGWLASLRWRCRGKCDIQSSASLVLYSVNLLSSYSLSPAVYSARQTYRCLALSPTEMGTF